MSATAPSPFDPSPPTDLDRPLVERALEGDKAALRQLVERHRPYVYNVALKMFGKREDAEDLAQEVLIKAITSLKTFRQESAFRTWLYRIACNHFLNTRRRGLELLVEGFEAYFDVVAAVPDEAWPDEGGGAAPAVEELRLRCTTGMLMCLDRGQRLAFVLGAMFGVSHELGAELLGVSPGNFRVRLHRARRDLYSWMQGRCGLVNGANPCRCRNKTRAYVRQGLVDPERLVFNADYVVRVEDVTRRGAREAMETVERLHEQVFLEHPFQVGADRIVDDILGNDTLRAFFDLN